LAQTKNFAGVTGVISMDGDRNAVKPAVVLKLQDLKFIYQETIQPDVAQPTPSPSPSPNPTKKR
jgi:branched-chain amino acid transport system substrate-binding protein